MRAPLMVMALLAVGLAGCSDGEVIDACELDPGGPDCGPTVDPSQVQSGKGVIRGVAVDPAINPIAGATVVVVNTDLETTTDENGGFVFVNVEPGTYFLTVTKPGFGEVQQSVDVEAGVKEPKALRILLERMPGTEPYYQGYTWTGFIGCSVRVPTRGQSCPLVEVVYPDHDFLVDYELDKVPDWVVSEMIWESTQELGGEMSFNLRRTDTNADTTDVEGPSPLSLTMDQELAASDGIGEDSALRVIIFTAHLQETEPPTGGWGVGLQVDQSFDVYTHVFYNYVPPEEWRFLEDTTVPAPPG